MRVLGRITASATSLGVWPCVLIEAGTSLNGITYTAPVIREAITRGVFEGRAAAAYGKLDAGGNVILDHVAGQMVGMSVLNTVGAYRNVRWSESEQAAVGELHLSLGIEAADRLNEALSAHSDAGNLDIPGLSIDGWGEVIDGVAQSIDGIAENV